MIHVAFHAWHGTHAAGLAGGAQLLEQLVDSRFGEGLLSAGRWSIGV